MKEMKEMKKMKEMITPEACSVNNAGIYPGGTPEACSVNNAGIYPGEKIVHSWQI
jgi:hypothetical protein